jgi:hypothetical protein
VLLVTVLDVASAICRMSKARRPSDKNGTCPGRFLDPAGWPSIAGELGGCDWLNGP